MMEDMLNDATYRDDSHQLASVQQELEDLELKIRELEELEASLVQQLDDYEEEVMQTQSSSSNVKRRESIKRFNEKPKKGVKLLLEYGEISEETPAAVAEYLYNTADLSKSSIGEYLGEPDEFVLNVLQEFANLYDFSGTTFDESLRLFLGKFRLPGESQKIDRMMEAFAKKYHQCHPDLFHSADTAFVLAFATIMLNTSLHNPNIKDKMTLDGFLKMNRGIDNGSDIPADFLTSLYESIQTKEFDVHGEEDKVLKAFVDPEKSGWMHKEGGSVKTIKKRFFVLKNSCLYYFENEQSTKPKGTIPLENLVVKPTDKPWWFEIRRENDSEGSIKSAKVKKGQLVEGKHSSYMINAPSEEDMRDWIEKIRAAMTKDPLYMYFQKAQQRAKNSSGDN